MAFKRLTVEEMLKLSAPWVSPDEEAHRAMARHPMLAVFLPHLQVAHSGIYQVRVRAENPKVWRLCEQAYELDATHDDLVRGIYAALTMLAQTSEPAEEYLRLCDLLLPEGIAHASKTYREEAGHAVMVASRLDQANQACLKAITFNERNLLALVETWLQIAKKLGQVEEERISLSPASASLVSEINMARLRWIRVVNTLVSAAVMVNLDPRTDGIIFTALRQAERLSQIRAAKREGASSSATLPALSSTNLAIES
jgi:hypothetical protein